MVTLEQTTEGSTITTKNTITEMTTITGQPQGCAPTVYLLKNKKKGVTATNTVTPLNNM